MHKIRKLLINDIVLNLRGKKERRYGNRRSCTHYTMSDIYGSIRYMWVQHILHDVKHIYIRICARTFLEKNNLVKFELLEYNSLSPS